MSEKKMRLKELKRTNTIDSMKRIDQFLLNYNENRDKHEVAIRLSRLDTLMETFESIQGEYESFDDSKAFIAANVDVRAKVEETYFRVKGGLVAKLPPSAPRTTLNEPVVPAIAHISGVKLPTISLPQFDGDLNEWLTFHDSFSSLIHSSPEIPCIQKFQYLRSALKGDALKLIESLTITANNYAVAWEALLNRYSNKYLLKKKHLQALMFYSRVTVKSPSSLRAVVEEFQRHVKILKQLGEPTDQWSSLLVQLLSSRMDDQTLKDWEELVSGDEEPTYENLIDFLTKKIRTLESLSINAEQFTPTHNGKQNFPVKQLKQSQIPPNSRLNSFAATDTYQPGCYACNQRHLLVKCPVFEKMQMKDRLSLVNSKKICSNCFRSDHFVRGCPSTYTCRICQKRHHTLLHPGFETSGTGEIYSNPNGQGPHFSPNPVSNTARYNRENNTAAPRAGPSVSSNSVASPRCSNVFLSTVVLVVLDGYGREHLARALLDSGSQCCLMSERLCQQLRLVRHRINQPIFGVGEQPIRAVGSVSTEIRSRLGRFSANIDCLVLRNLTTDLPTVTVPTTNWNIPKNIALADTEFNVARKVDLIIGAEHFYSFLKGGRIECGPSLPTLVESVFGWFISGKATFDPYPAAVTCCVSTLESLDRNLERFWEIEEVDYVTPSTTERQCEQFYKDTVSRESSGRYVVKYPKKKDFPSMIGNSFSSALRRLEHLERKLDKNSELKERYHAFMAEFVDLGHMQEVSSTEIEPPVVFYLPHHPVLKESSTTTKVRGVFDASAKTTTGLCLNDALLVGPVIQDELLEIVLRFRKYKVALLADIEKMYRQVSIHPDDRPLQRVLWRFNKDHPITKYELTTVTYGLTPSSFLATRTLHQLSEDEGSSFLLAASAVKRDFYMDDFIRGEDSIEKAIQLRNEMDELLKRGGFRLRKWCSNSPEVLDGIPAEDLATQSRRTFDPEETIKTLGICWEPISDQFKFDINICIKKEPVTKRTILSSIAKLYDPLGLIAPIIVRAKMLLQQLWLLKLDWDEEVPAEMQNKWRLFVQELPDLNQFRIDRYAVAEGKVQLHCFADASEVAYGACIYARTIRADETVKVELLASKSKVAPLKKRSIPRLELCAAQLAAHLYVKVHSALDMEISATWFWSDSMVVLHWLNSPPHTWKTYIANRVTDIQTLTTGAKWRHVSGVVNPSDLVSRGATVKQFISNQLWRYGPDWLQEGEENWPEQDRILVPLPDDELECRITSFVVQSPLPPPPNPFITRLFDGKPQIRCSSYHRLVRSTAYCLRYIGHSRKEVRSDSERLSIGEIEIARDTLVRIVQAECYPHELRQLKKSQAVSKRSTLKLLNPFVDPSGIIRVGGRLRLSIEPYSTKHPILLPGFHPFTRLLLMTFHRKLLHGGISLTLATVRDEYWPTNGRRAVRSIIRTCYRCFRTNPQPIQQPTGQLPLARTTPSRPFSSTGIDYCGPVFIKSTHRKVSPTKAYIALFVCFSSKAVHIELVGDLSTPSFLSALRRFIARRGRPEHIYSDNATNFSGAKNELHALYRMFKNRSDTDRIATDLANQGIQWHMIPPRAPNFGGLWEAAVKVAKKHLLRQLGNTTLLYEDMVTVLAQIEGCMNSRPLVPLSEDPNDFEAITPGHFLIGTSLQALPDPDWRDVPINRLSRFQYIQQRVHHFWCRWKSEYLKELQRQSTMNHQKVNLKVGQVVILQDQLLPPIRWPLARIVEVHPGHDEITRVVTLRTSTGGVFTRPVSKVCPLPLMDEHSSFTGDTAMQSIRDEEHIARNP